MLNPSLREYKQNLIQEIKRKFKKKSYLNSFFNKFIKNNNLKINYFRFNSILLEKYYLK